MGDYIPRSDDQFNSWQQSFFVYLEANSPQLGLVAADVGAFITFKDVWDASFSAHNGAQNAAKSACSAKDAARERFEEHIRRLVARLQVSPTVTNEHRLGLGVPVRGATRSTSALPKLTRPVVSIDTTERQTHTIEFRDENTPTSRRKPKGVIGCEIWVKVGDAPPVSASELSFLALDTATPYVAHYDGTQGGKTAYYWCRWVGPRNLVGPWSEVAMATIQI